MTGYYVDSARLASAYDRARALTPYNARLWAERLGSRCGFLPGRRVLDIGCGTGRFAALLAGPLACRVVGLDRSPEMLAEARRKHLPGVEWVQGDATSLPFRGGVFEGCLLSQFLHQAADIQHTLDEAHRVVRRGGVCAIRSPSHRQLRTSLDARFFPSALRIDLERTPDVDVVQASLMEAGFRRVERTNVLQELARSGADYLEKLRSRYTSTLTLIRDEEYAAGLAEAERYFAVHDLLEGRQREELTLTVAVK